MKLIKKIAAIMFAFMMVFSLNTNAKAVEGGASTTTEGSITIKNAKAHETYTLYKVLKLDSHDPRQGLYSYLPENDAWKDYFENSGNTYMHLNGNGYVETSYTDDSAQELAQALIIQAKTIAATDPSIKKTVDVTEDGDYTVRDLSLGYYVMDSTVGTLCALTTTKPDATIVPKHEQPTVSKVIIENNKDVTQNSEKIGGSVIYQTTINVKKGAKNYVLHDKMHSGLKFDNVYQVHDSITDTRINIKTTDYSVVNSGLTDCTFEIRFNQDYFDRINQDTIITVTYVAKVNENAPINTAMENKTWLTYGQGQKTEEKTTKTYTFGIPVFKYTEKVPNQRQGLKDVKFSLYTDRPCSNDKVLKFKEKGNNYLYSEEATGTTDILTSDANGNFNINGLKAGTYFLKEISTLDGYNKLKNPIQVTISQADAGNSLITVEGKAENDGQVDVLNTSGSLLPSTGGMGTTLIYLVGGALVLGSGFVLANKKRAKAK